ncbi:DUF317 domain-containing protein [Streptomyces sp. NPDC088387]|uniref:DUF317 domain-containing protein n=1 Tax=Streptomyces sp. NPDC088387 TaxID=3365859 RepID=UPI00380D0D0C
MRRSTAFWVATAELGNNTVWQARCGAHIPARLVTAFTAALADPKLLARINRERNLPAPDASVITRRTTDVPAVYVAGALEERVRSLAARRATLLMTQIASRQPPAKDSRSR